MKTAAIFSIAALVTLQACSSQKGPEIDMVGNMYPPQCRGDLSYVKAPVLFVPPSILVKVSDAHHMSKGKKLVGSYSTGIILIDETLRGWKREDTIRHERCHAIAGEWHP